MCEGGGAEELKVVGVSVVRDTCCLGDGGKMEVRCQPIFGGPGVLGAAGYDGALVVVVVWLWLEGGLGFVGFVLLLLPLVWVL